MNLYKTCPRGGLKTAGGSAVIPRDTFYPDWTLAEDSEIFLNLLAKKLLKVEKLITTRLSWEKAKEAYQKIIDEPEKHLGVILKWR